MGASVCVTVDGQKVVDLWGGTAERASGRPWDEDTVAVVMSSTKGATALCAHMLIDQGELELDAPVSRYWPEFAKGGKGAATVRMALNHTAGLPHPPHVGPRRRSGGLGRPRGHAGGRGGVAPLILAAPPGEGDPLPQLMARIMEDPQSIIGLVFLNNGGYMGAADQPLYYEAEIPGAGGITNARGLAGLYRALALGGSDGEVTLVREATATAMGLTSAATVVDATLGCRMRFALGFHKSVDNRTNPQFSEFTTIWSEDAFGHTGNGGSLGFADPRARMSFGYVMNQMSKTGLPDDRSQSLIDATYQALGYRHREPGVWI